MTQVGKKGVPLIGVIFLALGIFKLTQGRFIRGAKRSKLAQG